MALVLLLALGVGTGGCKTRSQIAKAQEKDKADRAKHLMEEAQRLMKEDQYTEAAKDAENAGLLLKTDPAPYQLLFEIRRAEGNAPAAALAIQQAVDLKPEVGPDLRKKLADMFREEGRWLEAVNKLKELAAASYLSVSELCTLARLQVRMGDPDGAQKTLRRIQEVDPDDLEAKTVEAEVLFAQDEEERALEILDELIIAHPTLASARYARARYYMRRYRLEDALRDLQAIQSPAAESSDVVLAKATVLERRHQPQEAARLLQASVDHSPRDVNLMSGLAEVTLELGDAETAEDLAETALALRPGSPRARYVLGRVAESKGRLPEAIHIYQEALEADPTLAAALSHLWPLLRGSGESTEAMTLLERLALLDEATIPEKVDLAEMYLESGTQLQRAIRYAREAVKRNPDNPRYERILHALESLVEKRARQQGIVIIRGPRHHSGH